MAILSQVRDPRVRGVTVTRVEVAPDMRNATVHVSVMGTPAQQQLALRGLASSAGFLQSQIAEKIETRYTPRLRFELDGGVKQSLEIARVLGTLLPPPAIDAEPQHTKPYKTTDHDTTDHDQCVPAQEDHRKDP